MKNAKKVTFASDEELVVIHAAPVKIPSIDSMNLKDILNNYEKNCEKLACKKVTNILNELHSTDGKHLHLNFTNEKISARMIDSLEPVLMFPSYSLNFKNSCFIDTDALLTLIQILDYYDTCTELRISLSGILKSSENFSNLINYAQSSISLSTLNLEGSNFDNGLMNCLCKCVRSCRSLRTLMLQNCSLSGRINNLLMAIKVNCNLKELYIGHNHLNSQDVYKFSEVLTVNLHLELLDLCCNVIKDEGVSYISCGISNQAQDIYRDGIISLNLSNNAITSVGLNFLSKALLHHAVIVSLNISNNNLTSSGMLILKESLIGCKRLRNVDLRKTKITDEGSVALAEFIMESKSLESLDLRQNDIQYAGLMALCLSLRQNFSLRRLNIDPITKKFYHSNDFSSQIQETLQTMNSYLMRNRNKQLNDFEDNKNTHCDDDDNAQFSVNDTSNTLTVSSCKTSLNSNRFTVSENGSSNENDEEKKCDLVSLQNVDEKISHCDTVTSINEQDVISSKVCPTTVEYVLPFTDAAIDDEFTFEQSNKDLFRKISAPPSINSSLEDFDTCSDHFNRLENTTFRAHEMLLVNKCGVAS